MAAYVSPGVYWREIDLSNYIPQLSSTQFGVVGTATKGPINDKTLITTLEQLVKTFGYPEDDHYLMYAADQYLKSGNQCWMVRVESEGAPAEIATLTLDDIEGNTIDIESVDPGTYYNGVKLKVSHSLTRRDYHAFTGADFTDTSGVGTGPWELTLTMLTPLSPSTINVLLAGTAVLTDDGFGVLDGSDPDWTGTVDYTTGDTVITSTVDPGASAVILKALYYTAFNLQVIRTVEAKEYTIEDWRSLTLDQTASDRYHTDVLERSYILKPFTTTVMPAEGTYTFTGGDDGLTAIDQSDYIGTVIGNIKTGLKLLSVPEEVDLNMLAIPGKSDDAIVQALIATAETRADVVSFIDPPYGYTPEEVVDWADGKNEFSANNAINSSYAAIYYPWIKIWNVYEDQYKYVPASGFGAAAFAEVDRRHDVWWAPAGDNIGVMKNVVGVERQLSQGERDFLYENRVNPINDFPKTGIRIWGQRTTQVAPTALDRINVRRLMIYLEKIVVTAVQPYVFRPNTRTTWNNIVNLIQPYLDALVSKEALYEGKVVCNDVTNTPDVIDQNMVKVNIFLKPVKIAEIIQLNFIILSTGAVIDEYVGKQF